VVGRGALGRVGAALLICAVLAGPVLAQQAGAPILTLDQEELFRRSQFGQALRARLAEASAKAEAEARRLDREAEAEERDLTARRATMTPEDFAPLAAAFDAKVQRLRAERDAAVADLLAMESAERQRFLQTATQVIGDYMVAQGAVAVVDKASIIVSLSSLDVTDAVVAELDRVLGDGAP
jgi:Skp family chaperone for outer membrane proteins